MKAEHRKELQTNTLADYLGRTVRGVRGGSGISWFKVFLVGVVVLGLFAVWWVIRTKSRNNAEGWARIEYNDRGSLLELEKEYKDTKAGQASRFTLGFFLLWEGIKYLGHERLSQQGEAAVSQARDLFLQLADECKDDPDRLAEAKYHIFVADEALAVEDVKKLDEAKKVLEELTRDEKMSKTAYAALAKKRLEQYKNATEMANITTFYREFRAKSQLPRTGS